MEELGGGAQGGHAGTGELRQPAAHPHPFILGFLFQRSEMFKSFWLPEEVWEGGV